MPHSGTFTSQSPTFSAFAIFLHPVSDAAQTLCAQIEAQYGALSYAEASFTMTPARKLALQQYLFEQHACPEFECVDHISREDGCKVYFTDGSWVICRFSGTEPLLRMAAEAETDEKAQSYIRTWKAFLSL